MLKRFGRDLTINCSVCSFECLFQIRPQKFTGDSATNQKLPPKAEKDTEDGEEVEENIEQEPFETKEKKFNMSTMLNLEDVRDSLRAFSGEKSYSIDIG